jgi:hypothetical protein
MESGALTGDAKIKERAAGPEPTTRAGAGKSLRLSLTPLRPAVDQGPHEGHVSPIPIRKCDSVILEDDLVGQYVGKARHRQTDYPRLAIGQASAVDGDCGFVLHGAGCF